MTNSAAGSFDLQKNKSSSSKEQLVTVTNDAMKDHNEGSSSGTNSGDLEVGQLPATKVQKKSRKEICKDHNDKKKAKLECYKKMVNDFGELKKESEDSRKDNERMHQLMQEQTKLIEELRSRVSLLTGNNESLLKQTDFLSFILSGVYKEKDEWKRKYEYLETLMTQQQLGSMSQDHPVAMDHHHPGAISQQQQHTVAMNQHHPVAISQQQQHTVAMNQHHPVAISQQQHVDMNQQLSIDITQQHLMDFDCYIDINQLLNPSGPPQPMQSCGRESEMHNTGITERDECGGQGK